MRYIVNSNKDNNMWDTMCVFGSGNLHFFMVIILFIIIECIDYFLKQTITGLSLLPSTDCRIER